ncbi:MAG TPA: hypothetical protein VK507_23385 [Iamia sp.]|nr:hypothetical protein [Iamia sp.]
MRREIGPAVLLVLALCLIGCGAGDVDGEDAAPSGSPTTVATADAPSTTTGAPERAAGGQPITLPAGANTSLPQGPGPSSVDGIMIAGVYALVSDGLAAVVTSGASEPVDGPDGAVVARTAVTVDEVLLGEDVPDGLDIVSGQAELAMEPGQQYVVIVGADSTFPGAYSFVEESALLDDAGDGQWSTRDGLVSLATEELRSTFERSVEHLAERDAARRAVITIEPTDDSGALTISGYAAGATLDLQVCVVTDDFDPVADAMSCDSDLSTVVTPDGEAITITYRTPEQLHLGADEVVDCSEARCRLVVADADIPDSVHEVYEPVS